MTKKAFREAMKRGLGRCVLELERTENVELYREIVLWGCTHDLAYDPQCEDSRAWYVYELVKRFPDKRPFLDAVIEKFSRSCSDGGWRFDHYCGLLGYFWQDGEEKAGAALWNKYEDLYKILKNKRKRRNNGTCPEGDDFERLCMELTDCAEQPLKAYMKMAEDIGNLFLEGSTFDAFRFEQLYEHCEKSLGKGKVQKALASQARSFPGTAKYLSSMQARLEERSRAWERYSGYPKTTEEFLTVYEERKRPSPWIGVKLRQAENTEAMSIFAERYVKEENEKERLRLLRIFTGRCHFPLSPEPLLKDALSENKELQNAALWALEHVRHEKVHQFAFALAERKASIPEAAAILACNYRPEDREPFVGLVKRIPVTYDDAKWHHVFYAVLTLLKTRGVKNAPTELLPYMYEQTLCSFCREYTVREMGRRHMLTEEILKECVWDSCRDTGSYAEKYMKRRKN